MSTGIRFLHRANKIKINIASNLSFNVLLSSIQQRTNYHHFLKNGSDLVLAAKKPGWDVLCTFLKRELNEKEETESFANYRETKEEETSIIIFTYYAANMWACIRVSMADPWSRVVLVNDRCARSQTLGLHVPISLTWIQDLMYIQTT